MPVTPVAQGDATVTSRRAGRIRNGSRHVGPGEEAMLKTVVQLILLVAALAGML